MPIQNKNIIFFLINVHLCYFIQKQIKERKKSNKHLTTAINLC